MEVKIKDGNGYVEADWTIEDGVMVVSPKEVKFEPKDGDVVVVNEGNQIFILKGHLSDIHGYCYCGWDFKDDKPYSRGIYYYDRYATEGEKKLLFDKLAEQGYEWDAEKKELVKLKWKPKVNEYFYYPFYCDGVSFEASFASYSEQSNLDNDKYIQKGCCFKTKEECQAFCDKLNQAISQVKP